jgi:hypothetical protein
MTVVWVVLAVLWFVVSVVLATALLRQRSARKQRNLLGEWPIPRVKPEVVDPVFMPGPFGPTLATEVSFVGRGPYVVDGGTSDAEAWILAVLARRAKLMFEFGTCTGKTAYLMARNSAPDAKVVTLTLAPENVQSYRREESDDETDVAFALKESTHTVSCIRAPRWPVA